VRERNEDAYLIDEEHALFAVADGLGGLPGGELASRTAIEALQQQMRSTPVGAEVSLDSLIHEAHAMVSAAGRSFGGDAVATTLTVARVVGEKVEIGHVGDSFALLIHQGSCTAITREHNVENERAGGAFTRALSHRHPYALTRVVGTREPVRPEFFTATPRVGDRLVLATDGLTDMVDFAQIAACCAAEEPKTCAENLIEAALARGGRDNITVVVIRVDAL
jgi:protein phosphatase